MCDDVDCWENGCWGDAAREAETTAARGGRDLGCESMPPEVGGRLELDPGRMSRSRSLAESGRLKWNEEVKGRKDWPVADGVFEWGARKDWLGSRKEWLFVGREVGRSISDV